ncbi:MAG: glycerophosphodiester phosphodiesterase [Acidimicrobiales bacterium]|nr:glycerophosphodiester phosphodiesterase [Acidimicrobiales bacterium]
MVVESLNPWLDKPFLIYAHQGGALEGASSTLAAIDQAISKGANAIELDVHATKDRELVVCHDASVDRTTNSRGPISSFSLAELKEMDNAYWFVPNAREGTGLSDSDYTWRGKAPKDPRYGIATLREVIETFPEVILNLDIKQSGPQVDPYEELLAKLLRSYKRGDDVIVASFLDSATEAFAKCAPEIAVSAGTLATADFYRSAHGDHDIEKVSYVALQAPHRYEDITVVDEAFVSYAHEIGIAVHVWTINEEEEMGELMALGVDGIISDRPSLLASVAKSQGKA